MSREKKENKIYSSMKKILNSLGIRASIFLNLYYIF